MSLRRITHNEIISRRSSGSAEQGNSIPGKSKNGVNASSRNAKRFTNNVEFNEQEGDKDRYLITYADLITLLLGLFIILYASSNIDMSKYQKLVSSFSSILGGGSSEKMQPINKMEETGDQNLNTKMQNMLATYGYKDYLRIEENERGVTIHILDDILFNSGDAEIKSSSTKILSRISIMLKSLPNDIRIEGHTDNIPVNNFWFKSNWHLSVARALNTAYFLINQEYLPADRVSIVGYAEYRPVAENSSEEGRRLNRRVDIVIIKK